MTKISPRILINALLILVCMHLVFSWSELYLYISWLDMLMHFLGGLLLGLTGIYFISTKINTPEKVSGKLIVMVSIFVALLIGGLWEVVEFNSNAILGFELVKIQNTEDTKSDLLFDLFGALSGAVCFLFTRNKCD